MLKTSTSSKILGRAWIYDTGDPCQVDVWEHELEPMTGRNRSGADWAKEHFNECFSDDSLRKFFNLPATGSFQVLFSGEMSGGPCGGYEYQEWDEQFDLDEGFKVAEIPEEFLARGA